MTMSASHRPGRSLPSELRHLYRLTQARRPRWPRLGSATQLWTPWASRSSPITGDAVHAQTPPGTPPDLAERQAEHVALAQLVGQTL